MKGEVSERLLLQVLKQAGEKHLLSEEHFTVDGTLIQAWANRRSFREKPDPPARGTGFGGKKLLRDTHQSKTDPEARLYRKSTAGAAMPSYLGHVVTENRNGLAVAARAMQSSAAAEREAAVDCSTGCARPGCERNESRWARTKVIRKKSSSIICARGAWSRMSPSTSPTRSGPAF